jgi:ADP-heptose:LPS heptosyltransferase
MKILVLSLLRLGDIVQHRELVKSLKASYPGATVDLLIHSQFRMAQDVIPEVSNWHHCPRQQLQQILVEKKQSPLCAHTLLKKMVDKINDEKYDIIINATHNKFSVRLMDVLRAKEKRGMRLENGRKVPDWNRWQTYMNERFSEPKGSRFHYLEVLHRSLGLEPLPLRETSSVEGDLILLQVLTSDAKKNWGLGKFRKLADELQAAFPLKKVFALCSPSEQIEISKYFSDEQILAPRFDELPDLLNKASLLITGDTSVQHLAAGLQRPILSLFMGSADSVKTAPWIRGAHLLVGSVACQPCKHSSPCSQYSHLCGDSLGISKVLQVASQILRKENPMQANTSLRNEFEVTLWTHYLDSQSPELTSIPMAWTTVAKSWKLEFIDFEIDCSRLQRLISQMSSSLLANNEGNFEVLQQEAKSLSAEMKNRYAEMQDSFTLLSNALSEPAQSHFAQFKRIKSAWIELEQLTELRKQLLAKIKFENISNEVMDV